MTTIIAFSGKLGAGKDTSANYLKDNAKLIFLVSGKDVEIVPFAKALKDFCVDYLGLDWQKVWGSQEDKRELTDIRWEGLPNYENVLFNHFEKIRRGRDAISNSELWAEFHQTKPKGRMTIREVLEQTGQLMRGLNELCWVRKCFREIEITSPKIAIIPDLRYVNEFKEVKAWGGFVLRLTRTTDEAKKNSHQSNVDLDQDRFDWSKFDAVIDNQNMTIEESNMAVERALAKLGVAGG